MDAGNGADSNRGNQMNWTDDDMLTALAMRDAGFTGPSIAKRLGRTRSAVMAMMNRVDHEYRASCRGLIGATN